MRPDEANRCPDHPYERRDYCRRCPQEAEPMPEDFKQRYHQAIQAARQERGRIRQEATR